MKMRRLVRRVSCFVFTLAFLSLTVFAGIVSQAEAADKKVIHAGYRTLSSSLPAERLMLHMGVWYPTLRRPVAVKVGEWNFRAARNAPVMKGPWPVIVLSHDVTGSAWSHHDFAAALARRGFIVAAPTHDYDHAEDMRMLFSDRELPLRALQIRAALDAVLEHEHIGEQADTSRIGYLGFGLTAPSGLLLTGASLTPEGWPQFVQELREASDTSRADSGMEAPSASSPWLKPYTVKRMEKLVERMEHRAEERSQKAAMRLEAVDSHTNLLQKLSSSVEKTHQRQVRLARESDLPMPAVTLPLLPPLSHDRAVSDVRFKALALVSPGYSMLFSRASLADVGCPVMLIGAGGDQLNLPQEQTQRFAAMLPNRPTYMLLPDADSTVLQAPCPGSDAARPLNSPSSTEEQARRRLVQEQLLTAVQVFFAQVFGK